ncbi:ABC-three component system middle component 6 [Streptomyces sp. NPDC021098]|uniref:ABC-three component system middle component 6 n=1 Tax=unclassified Streptomyces TaxID=2593676 RepID=UPI0037887510
MQLEEPRTVSQAWARLKTWRIENEHFSAVSFEWFVLALDMLFSLGAVELRQDLLVPRRNHAASAHR